VSALATHRRLRVADEADELVLATLQGVDDRATLLARGSDDEDA